MDNATRTFREAFPALDGELCFLDWGATGLLSEPARRAVTEYVDSAALCEGADATWMHASMGPVRARARKAAAALLGAEAEDIALVESTTAGLNLAAASIPLERGDRVVLSSVDYPAVANPWKLRRDQEGIELRYVDPADGAVITADDLIAAFDERTRVVSVSTLGWTSGGLLEVERLGAAARERGIAFVLDAAQSFGVVPLDLRSSGADFIAAGGHKWLASPLGAGILAVAPQAARRFPPRHSGFLSGRPPKESFFHWFQDPEGHPDDPIDLPPLGRSYEVGGTACYPGALGLAENLGLLRDIGVETVIRRSRALGDRVAEGLLSRGYTLVSPRDAERRGGLVVFTKQEGPEADRALVEELRGLRIAVSYRAINGVGGVRVSLHGCNEEHEVERLLGAL